MNASSSSSLLALCLGWPLFSSSGHQEPGEVPRSTEVDALFQANCASCHGVKGDGEGVTDLDRKARSFKDGGFSYGNTPKTVQRTITTGIPGTPMPAFGGALNEKQIADLAMYVIELGPGLPPPPKNTEMIVKDRPLVVRGMLPPIAEGALTHPRGLLIGMPDGFTFEYRVDDVRLLGLRQGLFVDRTDWVGRGGTGLQPLGRVVALVEGGNPGPTFATVDGDAIIPLEADLAATRVGIGGFGEVRVSTATLSYRLLSPEGLRIGLALESTRAATLPQASGLRRYWILAGFTEGHRVRFELSRSSELREIDSFDPRFRIFARRDEEGASEYHLLWTIGHGDIPGISNGEFELSNKSQVHLRWLSVQPWVAPSNQNELNELVTSMIQEIGG